MSQPPLLEVKNLKTKFATEKGQVTAVRGITFRIDEGQTLGIVGESGCGKSVTAESIQRLLDEETTRYEGEIRYKGKNLLTLSEKEMRKIRGNEISMVFQDPMSSLNPVYSIGNQVAEAIMLHQKVSKKAAYAKAVEILSLTGIPSPEKRIHDYPHELSGGLRQRVMIAIALSCNPSLLIADEPTTALDVTIQSQILELMDGLREKYNMGIIMITHDLGVVAEICDRVAVMYLGQIIEEADVKSLFKTPLHPYTRGLMQSIPQLDGDRTKKLHVIKGKVPSLHDVPEGCPFAARCAYSDDQCKKDPPIKAYSDSHNVKCWHYEKILKEEGAIHVG
ncbi:ABC transporter ATP-binding protein [Bacillus sp. DTU_2020_1000418_1_SI_GHA_SEK_038]|uniref:ABC transporter ATP-binding protein n=1 Tax=Bacillus sp. DTU_2020_1000418_1_SI_GHA_SEK_038 TaxID=3077585 RepID=UPI0028E9F014|nr:ABC transporter ATP-binding protein [Bacillus sp. DTU_2020_1000418_1_SI_GHA_SEK_038]WNS75164.1 ABC transporter ATP-binding protein [Bacillus sp. DTU_2020_1000418_1_SI_GHA_SEK_038]